MAAVAASSTQHEKVIVSGYVFSKIIHESSKSENDTEGLLCGNVRQTTSDHITDAHASGNRHELEFALFDIVPSNKTFSFYNQDGVILTDFKEVLESKLLLGWYKVRRNTSNRISLRERAVIKNLIDKFRMNRGLIFILFTPQCQTNRSTAIFAYKCFYCQKDEKTSAGLKVNIINLGHTGTHPEYRNRSCLIEPPLESGNEASNDMTSATAIPLVCDSYDPSADNVGKTSCKSSTSKFDEKVYNDDHFEEQTIQNTFIHEDGTVYEVHHIRKMYTETVRIMKQFQENLSETENEIAKYEKEIAQLRQTVTNSRNGEDSDEEISEQKSDRTLEIKMQVEDNASATIAFSKLKLENDHEHSPFNNQSQEF